MKVIVGAILLCWAAGAQPNWVQLSPSTVPPGREGHVMAYDQARHQVVMFGGVIPAAGTSIVEANDTWLWDGQNWHATSPTTLPAPRDRACMIYDPRIQKVVMFGGDGNSGILGDTWLWDGTNWTLQDTSAGAPPANICYSTFGFDEGRQQAILITSVPSSSDIISQTWSWDGSGWTQLHPTHIPPVMGSGDQMAYDRARGELVLAAHSDNPTNNNFVSTWAWNGTDWIRKPASGDKLEYNFNPGQATYDAAHQQILIFQQFQQTWTWNGTTWAQLHPANSPSDRILMAAAFDEVSQRVVAFGGGINVSPFLGSDTWVYTDPPANVQITVPAGIQFTFNGVGYTGSQTLSEPPGNYSLAISSPQVTGVGTQAVFNGWSDGGGPNHTVTVGAGGLSITGSFLTQYLLTTISNPLAGGTVTAGGYYNAGAITSPNVIPNVGFSFANWSGACSGSGACSVTMNAPATVTANFNAALVQFTVNVPATVQFTFNGTTYTGTQTIPTAPGSYTLSTTTPQATVAGAQLAFASWSDAGAISHSVTLSGVTQSITGTFKTQYLLTTSALPVNGGTVAPLSGGPYYDSGTLVNVGSVANPGFQFEYWSGACAGSASVCQVLMNAPQTVVGNFPVPPKWIQLGPATSPQPRIYATAAFDAGRNEIVFFGGYDSHFNYFPETWTWDGTNWTQRASSGPSGRYESALAYDPVLGQMVLFGGDDGFGPVNDTWIWNGNTGVWTKQNPASSPTARSGARLAWDGSRLILFGGSGSAGYLNETWAWTGSNWVQLAPATRPSARWAPAMTYDAARNQIVMFGGGTAAAALNDTWVWTGTNWVAKAPAAAPQARDLAMFAYDPVIQQSVLFSGPGGFPDEVWLWDGTNWRSVAENPSPSSRAAGSMAYDAARQQVVLIGGYDPLIEGDTWIFANNAVQQFYTLATAANPVGAGTIAAVSPGQAGPSYRAGSTVTLTASSTPAAPFGYWSGACGGSGSCTLTMLSNLTAVANYPPPPKWISLGPAKMPQSRLGAGIAFDSNRGETVLFSGGYQDHAEIFGNETWIWDGSNWSQRFPAAKPVPRSESAMAYDVTRHQVVLFGGWDFVNVYGDTWIWDGASATWTQVHPIHSPAARVGASLAWDGARLILFGGRLMNGTDSSETWAWDGTDWSLLSAAGGPTARQEPMMTFDPVRRQVVLFGGRAADFVTFFNDTWIWDGAVWTKRLPATSPSPRWGAAMAWHGAIQQVVLFSGDSTAGFVPDTWLWDGTNWTLHAEPVSPDGQSGSAAVWDSAAQQMILLSHYAGDFGEMWIYANNAVQQFHTLTTSASPAAGGTLSPAGTQTFRAGALVFLTATAAAGLEFQGWSGACAGSYRGCTPFLNANLTVTANFGFPLSWLQLNPATNAAPKGNLIFQNPISMAFDAARQQVVYFGGPLGDQTWTWNGITWTKRSPLHSPPPRSGHAMAYDAARQRVILFGGGSALALADTWSWDGTDWTMVDPGTGPGKRFNHAMAYDRVRQEIVMFGGVDENLNFYPDTWAWNGTQWILRQSSGGPPVRSDFGMVFDPVNAEVVLGPGYEGQTDTWGWNGSVWIKKFPAHNPPAAANHFKQMAYDEKLQRTLMLVDNYPSAPQTWVWDGMDWTQLSPTQSPTPRMDGGIVYDGVRQQVLLFGGDGPGGALNDTWVFAPPTAILTLQSVSVSKNAAGNYLVTFALKNTGNATATSVFGFSAAAVTLVGGASTPTSTFPLGQFSTILPGASGTFQAQFPATAGSGAHSFSAQGGYGTVGGTGNWSIAVRSVVFP